MAAETMAVNGSFHGMPRLAQPAPASLISGTEVQIRTLPEQAYGCIYSCDAQRIADNANSEPQWQRWGFRWEVAYMLHNGEITLGDSVTA